jgi:succinate dehydrogenase / fumarate reductase flavoprotein subunit
MQKNMQRNAAVYRIEKTLKEGCDRMDEVYQSFKDVKIIDKGLHWNTDLIETLELENLLRNYKVILSSSISNNSWCFSS